MQKTKSRKEGVYETKEGNFKHIANYNFSITICLMRFNNFVYAAERTAKGGFHYN